MCSSTRSNDEEVTSMAKKNPTTASLQPPVKIIENPPASSLAQALKNSQAQVDQAKGK
jgi:hypothetical protein